MCYPKAHTRGFTLVEMIVVIILLSILSAVVLPRLGNVASYQDASLHGTVLGSLRLAQKAALAQHDASVFWAMERASSDQWRIRVIMGSHDQTPPQLQPDIQARSDLSYSGGISGSLGNGHNLMLRFNQLGDVIAAKENVDLSNAATYPDSADAIGASIQFTDSRGSYCLSLTGYSYDTSCR